MSSLNISLDAMDPKIYHRITGSRLHTVLEGIHAAFGEGFQFIKQNCVLLRGLSECQHLSLIRFAAHHDMPVRFIELMPLSTADSLHDSLFLAVVGSLAPPQGDFPHGADSHRR